MSAGFILLRGKNSTGPKKWYQELQFQYSAALDNQINTYDSLVVHKEGVEQYEKWFQA